MVLRDDMKILGVNEGLILTMGTDKFIMEEGEKYNVETETLALTGATFRYYFRSTDTIEFIVDELPNSLNLEMKHIVKIEPFEEKEEKQPKTVWELEVGDEYYFISSYGEVEHTTWDDYDFDFGARDMGNAFLTLQEAEDEARARKLITKAKRSQGGYVPDWSNENERKYHIYFDHYKGEIMIDSYRTIDLNPCFGGWKDFETVEKFIENNKDDLTWYFTEYGRGK